MSEVQKVDYYHRIIPIVDTTDECIFVIPTAILAQAGMEVGDEFVVLPTKGRLIIKKMKQKRVAIESEH